MSWLAIKLGGSNLADVNARACINKALGMDGNILKLIHVN